MTEHYCPLVECTLWGDEWMLCIPVHCLTTSSLTWPWLSLKSCLSPVLIHLQSPVDENKFRIWPNGGKFGDLFQLWKFYMMCSAGMNSRPRLSARVLLNRDGQSCMWLQEVFCWAVSWLLIYWQMIYFWILIILDSFFPPFLKLELVLTGWIHVDLSCIWKKSEPRFSENWNVLPVSDPGCFEGNGVFCLELSTPNLWLLHFNVVHCNRCKMNGIYFLETKKMWSQCLVPVKGMKSWLQRITLRRSFSALPWGLAWISAALRFGVNMSHFSAGDLPQFYSGSTSSRAWWGFKKKWQLKKKLNRFDCIQIGADTSCPDKRAVNHCAAVSDWWEKWPMV